MCAINGILLLNGTHDPNLEQKLSMMQKVTAHRGPDASAHKVFQSAAIGTNRLAIVGSNDHTILQADAPGDRFAALNGEIVNYRALAQQLNFDNWEKSDGAIILPLIERYGNDFVKKLAGMFSIALYDRRQHTLQLWRDPLGIKPLYYYHSNEAIIFSSELKAIQAALDYGPDTDLSAINHILAYRFNPGRDTVFKEIKKVLPGETITFRGNQEVHERYWLLGDNRSAISDKVSIEEFRELFSLVIAENSNSDAAGGFFTSGGLDSSLVTTRALSVGGSSYTQPISLKFTPHPVVDEQYAQLLEKFLGKKFEWVEISDELARQTLEDIIPYLDEPLENPIHVGTYLMAKRARELGLKSVLTGDGSDEFFLGYERHANWFNHPDPAGNYPKLHYTLKPEEAEELYKPEIFDQISEMTDGNNKAIGPIQNIQRALFFERSERLPEYHNMRLDRMTMAHGVEARVPFLDHRIVDYSLMIPPEILFGKTGKQWLQDAARLWLPKAILTRPKILFPSLPDQWLSGKGSVWAADILLSPSAIIHQWIRRNKLELYINQHNDNLVRRGKLLWALIVLELWLNHQSVLRLKVRSTQ